MNHSTTVAPSEAHLEQWIATHPDLFGYVREDGTWIPFVDRFIGRQIPLPCGIADFLAINYIQTKMTAIELKKGEVDSRALAQVLRYMSNLDGMIDDALYSSKYAQEEYTREERDVFKARTLVGGMLVGNTVSDRHLCRACRIANVSIILYSYTADGYTFNLYEQYDEADDTQPYFFHENPLFRTAVFSFLDNAVYRMRRYQSS